MTDSSGHSGHIQMTNPDDHSYDIRPLRHQLSTADDRVRVLGRRLQAGEGAIISLITNFYFLLLVVSLSLCSVVSRLEPSHHSSACD